MNLSLNKIKWALSTREWHAALAGKHEWLPGSYRAHPRDLPGSAGGASAPAAIAACTDVAGPVSFLITGWLRNLLYRNPADYFSICGCGRLIRSGARKQKDTELFVLGTVPGQAVGDGEVPGLHQLSGGCGDLHFLLETALSAVDEKNTLIICCLLASWSIYRAANRCQPCAGRGSPRASS